MEIMMLDLRSSRMLLISAMNMVRRDTKEQMPMFKCRRWNMSQIVLKRGERKDIVEDIKSALLDRTFCNLKDDQGFQT